MLYQLNPNIHTIHEIIWIRFVFKKSTAGMELPRQLIHCSGGRLVGPREGVLNDGPQVGQGLTGPTSLLGYPAMPERPVDPDNPEHPRYLEDPEL